jgi:hypothetical protein
VFPPLSRDELRKAIFHLCYKQHGGSGLNFTYTEVLELQLGEVNAYLKLLQAQRASEAKAINDAYKSGRGG